MQIGELQDWAMNLGGQLSSVEKETSQSKKIFNSGANRITSGPSTVTLGDFMSEKWSNHDQVIAVLGKESVAKEQIEDNADDNHVSKIAQKNSCGRTPSFYRR